MKRYHVLGITLIAGAMIGLSVPAHAINHAYRDKLQRSGCTEMNAGQGCNINKSAAWNNEHFYKKEKVDHNTGLLGHLSGNAETVLGMPISAAADYLLAEGWKPDNGEWHKADYIMRLVVEDDTVVNAQLTK